MNEKTQENIAGIAQTLARWTTNILQADPYLTAIEANLPDQPEGDSYHDFRSSYGDIYLDLWQAEAVAEIGPYMRALRFAGFKRVKKTEDSIAGNVTWIYEAGEGIDKVTATVKLALKMGEQATCRYVKTGTKEIDVNELLCGEKLEAWVEANEVRELA